MDSSFLHKILKNWPDEPERPPLLLCGLNEKEWEPLLGEIISIFTCKDVWSNHPDIVILERDSKKQNIEVKQTREFIGKLSISTYELPFKLGIVPAFNLLNIQSQNTLLKTLEEPLKNRYLILGTVSKNKVLPTVLSRSIIINLSKPTQAEKNTSQNNDLEEFSKILANTNPARRLFEGQNWFSGKNDKVVRFFDFIIPKLHSELIRSVQDNNVKKCNDLSNQLQTALNYSDQLNRTSGASPKLLFESFLLKIQ